MTMNSGDFISLNPDPSQEQWDQMLASQGLGLVQETDALGLGIPAEVHCAWNQVASRLGRAATSQDVASETARKLETAGYNAQEFGFPTWGHFGEHLSNYPGLFGDPVPLEALSNVPGLLKSPFEASASALAPKEVDMLLDTLDEDHREIVYLSFGLDRCEPRTPEEVAELLGCSAREVRRTVSRALRKLRQPLAPSPKATLFKLPTRPS